MEPIFHGTSLMDYVFVASPRALSRQSWVHEQASSPSVRLGAHPHLREQYKTNMAYASGMFVLGTLP